MFKVSCQNSTNPKDCLQRRALNLARARAFFAEKNICEVDCIALGQSASIDLNIDLFEVLSPIHGKRFLFSSPEYPMKRLLSEGSGDIYYLGHVWRHEEAGTKHSPEFLMAEWYRVGYSFEAMMNETVQFVQLFIGLRPVTYISYLEAFQKYVSIDPFRCSHQDLQSLCSEFEGYPIEAASRGDLLNLIIAIKVEPRFDPYEITVLYHYPASQAALAIQVEVEGRRVAERFELFCETLELANGYHELTCAKEQKERFIEENAERIHKGKSAYPIDRRFLSALEKGLPDCSGVAVGLDRVFMIKERSSGIKELLPIGWTEA